MQLVDIVRVFATALIHVDAHTTLVNTNRRTKDKYLCGAPSLTEVQLTREVASFIRESRALPGYVVAIEVPYPDSGQETCDLVLSPEGQSAEWAIEVKYLRLVGNNGNNNDYLMQKALSPYLKDRSIMHDAQRLVEAPGIARNKAVLAYAFEFDRNSPAECARRCAALGIDDQFSKNLARTLRNVAPATLVYTLEPVIRIIGAALQERGYSSAAPAVVPGAGLTRHPCGILYRVVAWELA